MRMIQWRMGAPLVGIVGLALGLAVPVARAQQGPPDSPDTADQVRDKFYTGTSCMGNDVTDKMARVGATCVDVYKASVWSTPTGRTQFGVTVDDYPCSNNANDCTGATAIYARSEAGVMPSRFITWFQAQQACANSGKRLLTNAEWQQAAAGTPDGAPCIVDAEGPGPTGTAGCESNWGTFDMVGNIWEWVADWIQGSDDAIDEGFISSDLYGNDVIFGIDEVFPEEDRFPPALIRGGTFRHGTAAGVFALAASQSPSSPISLIGFRCGR